MTSTQAAARAADESGARLLLGKPVAAAITEEVRAASPPSWNGMATSRHWP